MQGRSFAEHAPCLPSGNGMHANTPSSPRIFTTLQKSGQPATIFRFADPGSVRSTLPTDAVYVFDWIVLT